MKSLGLFQEPLEPTPFELEREELLEDATSVDPWVVGELRTFYERKDDRVFETGEDGPYPVQGERVFYEHIIGLHISLPSVVVKVCPQIVLFVLAPIQPLAGECSFGGDKWNWN
jgi:hypothetical protein